MKANDVTKELMEQCSYIVIYSTTNDHSQPFFTEYDYLNPSQIPWVMHCDWTSDDNGEVWQSWQHAYGKDARMIYNDIKDHLPKPYRFIVFRPFEVEKETTNFVMSWIVNDENDERNERNERGKEKSLEGMLSVFYNYLEDESSACYPTQMCDDIKIVDEYLFVRWD